VDPVAAAFAVMFDLKTGIKIGAHTSRGAVRYSLCFSGAEALAFCAERQLAESRGAALVLMQAMMDAGFVEHMVKKDRFVDSDNVFFRVTRAPPLHGALRKDGLLSVSFSKSEYFSMFAQLDQQGLRLYRAREHSATASPLFFVAADDIESVALRGDEEEGAVTARNAVASETQAAIAESFRNAGDLAMGYQGVVWTFKPAMALWNAALKRRDAKNACFVISGAVTGHEFAVRSRTGDIVYFALGTERARTEWLLALDAGTMARAACQRLPYGEAVALSDAAVGEGPRDYGRDGVPITSLILRPAEKNALLRSLVPAAAAHRGWSFRANVLRRDGVSFAWNGFCCTPLSATAVPLGCFVFDSASVTRFRNKQFKEVVQTAAADWSAALATIVDMLEQGPVA
jgi:hypothetical protein